MLLVATGAVCWFDWFGNYPENSRSFSIPLTDTTTSRGVAEEHDDSLRIEPDKNGVAIVLIEDSPIFLAEQFHHVELQVKKGGSIRRAEWVWQSRANVQKIGMVVLQGHGDFFTADVDRSPDWRDRIDGVGMVFKTPQPIVVTSVTLYPPKATFAHLLVRVFREWTFREGYEGYTINGLRGAGPATMVPMSLAGGGALVLAAIAAVLTTVFRPSLPVRAGQAALSSLITIWILATIPWLQQLWTEAAFSMHAYAGKTEAERRLSGPDSRLYSIASWVNEKLPPPPQRIFVVSSEPDPKGSTNYKRTKIHYYLAPYNVLSKFPNLPSLGRSTVEPGDYALILDSADESYQLVKGKIAPGYRAALVAEYRGARLYKLLGKADD